MEGRAKAPGEGEHPMRQLLREWERRNRINLDCHNWAERRFERINTVCSIVSIASLVSLGVAASAFDLSRGSGRYVVVVLSALAAITSVLLSVRDFGSIAHAHKTAARQYGALCREIERVGLLLDDGTTEQYAAIVEIQRRWDWSADAAPNVPKDLRREAEDKEREQRAL